LKTINLILIFIIGIYSLSCKDNSNPINPDTNLLYSAYEIIVDYHDSIPRAPFPTYGKSIILNYKKTFSKVKFEGIVDSFNVHYISNNPCISAGLYLDTNSNPGDTVTILCRYSGNFSIIDTIKYSSNELFDIFFMMVISPAQRGDFIRVKNLKIYEIE